MKANFKNLFAPKPKSKMTENEMYEIIHNHYSKIIKEQIQNAVLNGSYAMFQFIFENYYINIKNAKTKKEKQEHIDLFFEYIEREYQSYLLRQQNIKENDNESKSDNNVQA